MKLEDVLKELEVIDDHYRNETYRYTGNPPIKEQIKAKRRAIKFAKDRMIKRWGSK